MKSSFIARLLIVAACAFQTVACTDPIGPGELSDFLIRSPGDYFFATMPTFRPSAVSTDSIIFQWEQVKSADSYSLVFVQVPSADSANEWRANLDAPTFTIAVPATQTILVPFGIPNPALDTIPLPQYPVLQYGLKLTALDAVIAAQPKGVSLYYVWTIEAKRGSATGRSIDRQRMTLIRS